jgi:glycine/sarcosine N-methyltransferase
LIFEDWNKTIARQGETLNALIAAHLPHHPLKILDCACGIGTQSLGFALNGHDVTASDLSPAAVTRARREADLRSLAIDFHVSDMTSLAEIEDRDFDVVAALDNALPHLSIHQLPIAVAAMASKLKTGGLFLASIRDYDALILNRPTFQEPAFYQDKAGRRIVHQVWDWLDAERYMLHLYITEQFEEAWTTRHFISEYRRLTRHELSAALIAAGFHEVLWQMPAESGFYQPLVIARKH